MLEACGDRVKISGRVDELRVDASGDQVASASDVGEEREVADAERLDHGERGAFMVAGVNDKVPL